MKHEGVGNREKKTAASWKNYNLIQIFGSRGTGEVKKMRFLETKKNGRKAGPR